MKLLRLSALSLLFASHCLWANTYAVLAPGYADVDVDGPDTDGFAYKFAIGYELHPQWYVEAGFQQLADENGNLSATLASGATSPEIQANALYLALLGKAAGRQGELFYRIGVLSVAVDATSRIGATGACSGDLSAVAGSDESLCRVDDTRLGGVIGIGFDFAVTPRWFVRLEAEHIQAENDFQANGAYLGVRYNF